jgi:hypothetical protein
MKEEREMHASTANLYSKTVFKVYSDLRYNGEVVHTTQEEAQGYEKQGNFPEGEKSPNIT